MEYKKILFVFLICWMLFPASIFAETIVMNRENGSSMFNGSELVAEGEVIKTYEKIDVGCDDCFAYFYDLKILNLYKGIEKKDAIITVAAFNKDFVAYPGQKQLVFLNKGISSVFSGSVPENNEALERRKNIYKTYPFVTPFIEINYVNNENMYSVLSCGIQQFPFEFDNSVMSKAKVGKCSCFSGSYKKLMSTLTSLQMTE